MKKIIDNEEFRNDIANNATHVRDKYSVSNIMQKWNNILDIKYL